MSNFFTNEDNETIKFDSIVHFLKSINREVNLPVPAIELLLEQFEGLRVLFGEKIPREDVLRIISHQIEVTKSGHIREPVDIVEFIESPEYLNQGAYIRPIILEHLVKLHEPNSPYYEVVLGGGIGIGKNYFTDMSIAYDLYKLSCLYSPQSYYGLAPGSKIIFIHQSKTEKLAKEVVFDHFGGRLQESGYFPKHFAPDPQFTKVMKFPNRIEVMPISSADTSALGMNVFGGAIDEMNFMSKIKKSKRQTHSQDQSYDQAEVLYTTIIRRMESRFRSLNELPGKLYLISSANYKNDFIDRKEVEAAENPHVFVMHLAQWESFMNKDGTLMKRKFSGKMFFVRKPSETASASIYDEMPEVIEEEDKSNIIEVPIEYKRRFEKDLIGSLRDIAGVAVVNTSKFIGEAFLLKSFSKYKSIYGEGSIFTRESIQLSVGSDVSDLIDIPFLRRISPLGPYAVHIDLAVSGDAAGIAIGHAIGGKDVGLRQIFDKGTGVFVQEPQGILPVYGLPGLLQVKPPKDGEIELNTVRGLVGLICDYLPVYWLTMDRHNSATFLQYFRGRNVASSILSLDRTPDPHVETKFAIKEGRVFLTRSKVLLEEMPNLDQDLVTGKIDHPEGGSKDLSDAAAGVVFTLSNKKSSYRKLAAPKVIPIHVINPEKHVRSSRSRPSSGRDPLY
jgi:hypothetical protein